MTTIILTMAEWQALKKQKFQGKTIGFIPTMGNLHRGHLSLCARSLEENEITVLSIFVNPTQFNDQSDLVNYPRTIEQDVALLTQQGVDYCLILNETEMYADNYRYQVLENQLANMLEGPIRPGHFSGMLTIVLKLLLGVGAQKAYFGKKDYQQYLLVDGMVKSFFIDCEIIPCPIIREASLLPFSSRNARLTETQRQIADAFAETFNQVHQSLNQIEAQLKTLPLTIDYLIEFEQRRLVAVRIGPIRLLDNYAIKEL